jgi:hypothetical protein
MAGDWLLLQIVGLLEHLKFSTNQFHLAWVHKLHVQVTASDLSTIDHFDEL